jgi:hypothetical protein
MTCHASGGNGKVWARAFFDRSAGKVQVPCSRIAALFKKGRWVWNVWGFGDVEVAERFDNVENARGWYNS